MNEADKATTVTDLPEAEPFPPWVPVGLQGMLAGLLLGGAIAGMTLLIGLDMESQFGQASAATTRWFALFGAMAGFYAGNCFVGPKPVRSVLVHLAVVVFVVFVGWSLVVDEKLIVGPRRGVLLLEGAPAAAVGVMVVLAGGVWAARPLFQKPLTATSVVAALLTLPLAGVGLVCAVWHLLVKYGGMG